jgi:ABC-type multidrug transport system ATPase subunit
LLRLVATLVRPTSGIISIDGIDAVRLPLAARRKIAYVRGDLIPAERLRVDEYLWFVARARGGESSRRRIAAMGELCGLTLSTALDRLPDDGRAALAIAAALIAGADVLLLDDPLAGILDPVRRERLAEALRAARAQGTTMLVAGRPDELSAMSSRIVTLEHGQMREGLSSLRQPGEVTWAR